MKKPSLKEMVISNSLVELAEGAKSQISIAIPYGSHIIYRLIQLLIAIEMLKV